MAANPITYQEFKAFCWARADLRPSAWEIDALMQLDSHVLAASQEQRARSRPGEKAKGGNIAPIPVTDRAGVRSFMRGLMARKNGAEGKK